MVRTFLMSMVSLFLLVSCYTMIKHPQVVYEDDPQYEYQIYYSDDCNSCHQPGSDLALSVPNNLPRLNYIYGNQRWDYFYEHPWWQTPYFSDAPSGQASSGSSDNGLPTSSVRSRFPGAGSSGTGAAYNGGTTTRITGGGSSGTTVRHGGSEQNTGSTSGDSAVRSGSDNDSGARSAVRGSGSSGKKGDSSSGKPVRRKKK